MRPALLAPALIALHAAACASPAPSGARCGYVMLERPVIVLEHGEQTSALARLAGGCLDEMEADPALGQDQMLLDAHGRPFVAVNTDGSLRALDAKSLRITETVDAYPDQSGASSVPHSLYGVDADAAGDLWASRDDVARLAIFTAGGAPAGTVDLASLDPKYGNPRMNGLLIEGHTAFVALGFLATPFAQPDADLAWQVGAVARIDTGTHQIASTIPLHGHNPVRKLIPTDATGKVVVVATPGQHDAVTAEDGIDRVDLEAGTATQLISETELGGSVDEVVWAGEREVYAIVLGPQPGLNPTSVVAIDPTLPPKMRVTRTLAEAPWFADHENGQAYVHTGLALDGGFVLVGDQTAGHTRIRVFSRTTGEEQPSIPTTNGAPTALLAIAP